MLIVVDCYYSMSSLLSDFFLYSLSCKSFFPAICKWLSLHCLVLFSDMYLFSLSSIGAYSCSLSSLLPEFCFWFLSFMSAHSVNFLVCSLISVFPPCFSISVFICSLYSLLSDHCFCSLISNSTISCSLPRLFFDISL